MDNLTPGRKLILDLLAKSVAKIQAAEAGNEVKVEDVKTDGRKGGMKRESMEVPEKFRKKMKAGKKPEAIDGTNDELQFILKPGDIKAENAEYKDKKKRLREEVKVENSEEVELRNKDKMLKNLEVKIKSKKLKRKDKDKENVKTPHKSVKIKTEYTEIKTEEVDLESDGKTEFKANIVKNENKKDIIKVDDESKIKSHTFVIKKEPVGQNLKKQYFNLEHDAEVNMERIRLKKENGNDGEDILGSIIKELKTEDVKIKNKGKKDSIKVDDNLDVKSKLKTEAFEETTKVPDVKTREPLKQSPKKEHSKVDSKDLIKDTSNFLPQGHTREDTKTHTTKRKSGFTSRRFTTEEDQTILAAIEQFGDKIDIAQIAEDLQRTVSSIGHEVQKLKAGKTTKKLISPKYTLTEDLVILDAVLANLGEDSLKVVNLTQSGWREIGAPIGKSAESLRKRWDTKLCPWILQHFAGTRNLDLKRPLANYLVENFHDVNSIDWSLVVSKPEFAGHTQLSLRHYFSSFLFRHVRHKDDEDITLEMIAEFANAKYAEGGRKVLDKDLKRQQEIIDYFECYVKTKGIINFL